MTPYQVNGFSSVLVPIKLEFRNCVFVLLSQEGMLVATLTDGLTTQVKVVIRVN